MTSGKVHVKGRKLAVLTAVVMAFAPALAEARAGKGSSLGSRGSKTESAAPRTNTAPAPAQSFQRSSPAQPAVTRQAPAQAIQVPAPRPAVQQQPSFASRAMSTAVGFVTGAAIANLLRNTGLFDGMGGLASILGMLLTFALFGALGAILVALLRPQPETAAQMQGRLQALAGAGGGNPPNPNPAPPSRLDAPRSTFGRRGAGARR